MDTLSWPLHELLVMTAREKSLLKDYFVLCLEAAYSVLNILYSFYKITNIFQCSDNKMYADVKPLLLTFSAVGVTWLTIYLMNSGNKAIREVWG